jgi:outer membrane receptor protein involved in Fe transport
VPGAVERVCAGGVIVENAGPVFGSLRVRHFGSRDLVEDGSVRSDPTTIVNLQAGVAVSPRARIHVDVFNLLNREVSDIDYFYRSRLPGEGAGGVDDVHFHPALPRSIRIGLNLSF